MKPILKPFPDRMTRILVAASALVVLIQLTQKPLAHGHDVFMMNSNHTDYNWNATAAEYEAAMLADLDYYLDQIDATSGHPPHEQARYVPDCWWWLYLYEQNRQPEQFERLIQAIRSGHITIPLNPFVTLYGALPTETAIRAGYYPGRIAREYDLEFLLAENVENHTSPWGLASIWAGSQIRYTWKGVCGCVQSAPSRQDDELFWWQGPDGKTLLFKWYNLIGNNTDWGGYSETRDNLGSVGRINLTIDRTRDRMPGVPFTGLFGAGWDDVGWATRAIVDTATAFNASGTTDRAIVSNGVDFFQAIEASQVAGQLRTLRGGWGNDWDMWPASLAERTSRTRRALTRIRTAEALAAWVHRYDPEFWSSVRETLEHGLFSAWKYFEHGWDVTAGGPSLQQMQADKELWTQDIEGAVTSAVASAEQRLAALFNTPDQQRLAVFNPLGFPRTDVAELPVADNGPYVVHDVATNSEVPSQIIQRDGHLLLQFLASDLPSLGYRIYRYDHGSPSAWPPAAAVSPQQQTIENDAYRVETGQRGRIVSALHKLQGPDRELAGSLGLNDYGAGVVTSVTAENVGPVSATLRIDLSAPLRTTRITLFRNIDRVEIRNEILQNETGFKTYSFHSNIPNSEMFFEEIGAIARPGMVTEGGDFLPGTRADRMTLNHFVAVTGSGQHIVISNQDAYAMKINDSTNSAFDLTGNEVHVVVMEQGLGAGTWNQGGDDYFLNRFALRGVEGPFDAAEALRTSLAHQNPFHVMNLPRAQTGPMNQPTGRLLIPDSDDVVVTAFKPAEDAGRGFVVRLWELSGNDSQVDLDVSSLTARRAWKTSLIETDQSEVSLSGGFLSDTIGANEIKTYRMINQFVFSGDFDEGLTFEWSYRVD